jgi:glycolate oxidase FAD binding subunit
MDIALESFSTTIRNATAKRTPLRLRGGGSKDFYGQGLQGEIVDTRGYAGIVDYDPTELVITARCGTPLADIEAALSRHHQMLAFEPPHFGSATLGGCIAAGLSGPRRAMAGAVRDFVLGVTLMNHRGEILRFGGRVMKNVAGYDVSRLLAGSLGTLGLILEVSLKVLPRPSTEITLSFEMDQASALRQLNHWGGKPLPISASVWCGGILSVRLSGTESAVRAAIQRLLSDVDGEAVDENHAHAFWNDIREQRDPWFSNRAPLWRLSVPATAAPLPLNGDQLIEWNGALRWLHSSADAATIRATTARAGGHATLFRTHDKSPGVFQPLAAPLLKVHRALKAEFDPGEIFNPGRLYSDL